MGNEFLIIVLNIQIIINDGVKFSTIRKKITNCSLHQVSFNVPHLKLICIELLD